MRFSRDVVVLRTYELSASWSFVGSRLVEGGLGFSRYRAELFTLVQVELNAAADTEHSPVQTRNRSAQAFADCERVSTKFFSSQFSSVLALLIAPA